jgi:hypothetical protein
MEKPHSLHSLHIIIRVVKSRKTRWAVYLKRTGGIRNA